MPGKRNNLYFDIGIIFKDFKMNHMSWFWGFFFRGGGCIKDSGLSVIICIALILLRFMRGHIQESVHLSVIMRGVAKRLRQGMD